MFLELSFVYIYGLGVLNLPYILTAAIFIKYLKFVDFNRIILLIFIFVLWISIGLIKNINITPSIVAFMSLVPLALKRITIKRESSIYVNIVLLYYFFEMCYRINASSTIVNDASWIYKYKLTTFAGEDSNQVGFTVLCLFIYLVIIKASFFQRVASFLLLMLTFSRASIFASSVFLLYQFNRKFTFILLPLLACLLFLFNSDDYSLLTKISINTISFTKLLEISMFDLLFGYGVGNFDDAIIENEWTGHTIIFYILYSFGILPSLILFWMFFNKFKSNQARLFLLFPLISGLSYFPGFFAFYTLSALIIEENSDAK
jgi:hypothetical protein